jgi:hypothetical protein
VRVVGVEVEVVEVISYIKRIVLIGELLFNIK